MGDEEEEFKEKGKAGRIKVHTDMVEDTPTDYLNKAGFYEPSCMILFKRRTDTYGGNLSQVRGKDVVMKEVGEAERFYYSVHNPVKLERRRAKSVDYTREQTIDSIFKMRYT